MSQHVHWSREAILSLIGKVREHEVLWNIKHRLYPKKTLKRRLFEEIKNELIESYPGMASLTADEVFAKFAYIRGNFQRVLRKIRNTPNGLGGKPEPKWEYFKACSFLLAVYDNTPFESNLEFVPQEEVVYESSLEDMTQTDFSPWYSPRSMGASPAPSPASTTSPIDAPCTSPESQSPSPQDIVHTPSTQDVHTPSHQSTSLSATTLNTSVTSRSKKRKLVDSCDTSGKIVQTLDTLSNAMNTFIQTKQDKKPGKHDFVISSVQSFLNSFPISDSLKMEFGSKVVLLMHEYMQKYKETKEG